MKIRPATAADVPQILRFIQALADYERLSDAVVATEARLRATLFGPRPYAEVILAVDDDDTAAGFALFFHNYSTFLGQPGIWLEDLFVVPERRDQGIGRALLAHVAALAVERRCGRLEWSVLDWNAPAISFYTHLGADRMDDWTTWRLTGDALASLGAATLPG